MDIVNIKQRKRNLEEEITKLLNSFHNETSCDVIDISIGKTWEYGKSMIINNIKLDVRIY